MLRCLACLLVLFLVLPLPVPAQTIDFGDDSSLFSNNGECDDPRFEGPGMTSTLLRDEDRLRDASDCRTAWEAGRITLLDGPVPSVVRKDDDRTPAMPDFGADTGEYTRDGECDDPRFEGPGMTTTPLLVADMFADASDCRAAWEAGELSLRTAPPGGSVLDGIEFGFDSGEYTRDGECDDPRFEGPGMTTTPLLVDDMFADASDCRAAWEAGELSLRGSTVAAPEPSVAPGPDVAGPDGIDFGDDTSEYANNGECDDRRFDGPGMTTTLLLHTDIGHDASDCRAAWDRGELFLRDVITEPLFLDGIDFGTDSGLYANDGECDDPRFEGPGMTTTPLLDDDIRADATDCSEAWRAGDLRLRDADAPPDASGKDETRRSPRSP